MTSSLNFTLYSGTRRFPWKESDVRRLSKLCGEFLGSNYSIDIIQIAEERRRAFRDGVTESPTVFVELPCGRKHKIGGFVETEKYLRLNHKTAGEIRVQESGAVPCHVMESAVQGTADQVITHHRCRLASDNVTSMFPKCVKFAALVFVLTQSNEVFGERKCSSCGVTPQLVFPTPATKEPPFVLHVSLQSYSPAKWDATDLGPPSKAALSDMDLTSPFQSVTNAPADPSDSLAERWRKFTLEILPAASLPPLLTWLRGWRMDIDGGLYLPLQRGASRLAFAYSDIFETRGDPDKGGHGMSILFRYDFGTKARSLRSIR